MDKKVVVSLEQTKHASCISWCKPAGAAVILHARAIIRVWRGGARVKWTVTTISSPFTRCSCFPYFPFVSSPGSPVRAGATRCRAAYSVFNYVHYHYCYQQRRHQQLISIPLFCQTELELKSQSGVGLKTLSTRPSEAPNIPASQI